MSFGILVLLAGVLPVLLGLGLVWALMPKRELIGFKCGVAIVVGWIACASIAGLSLRLTATSRSTPMLLYLCVLTLFVAVAYFRLERVSAIERTTSARSALSKFTLSKTIVFGLAVLLILRFLLIAIDGWTRPMFGIDALGYWGQAAKGSFDTGAWRLNVDEHGAVPPFVPALQLWVALVTGIFDDSYVNLAWPSLLLAAGFVTYGFVAETELGETHALAGLAASYFVISQPLLNVHAAMGGYADLILAVEFCAALFLLQLGINYKRVEFFLLAAFPLVAMPFTKKWGWVLLAVLAIAYLLHRLAQSRQPLRSRLFLLGLAGGFVGLWMLTFVGVKISHHTVMLREMKPDLQVFLSAFVNMDNFHLVLPLFTCTLFFLPNLRTNHRDQFALFATSILLLLIFLAYTLDYGGNRDNFVALNRNLLVWTLPCVAVCVRLYLRFRGHPRSVLQGEGTH